MRRWRHALVISAVGLAAVAGTQILTPDVHWVPAHGDNVAPGGPAKPGLPMMVPDAGGPGYYAGFSTTKQAGWADPKFFPIGVWFESVIGQSDIDMDKAAGLNTYVELTDNSDLPLIRANGMFAIPSKPLPGYGPETVAWLITDEADLSYGAGSDPWTGPGDGSSCVPPQDQNGQCGYTVMQTLADQLPKDGRPRYANFGKGVLEFESDDQAQKFVNGYTDITSADLYYYTDPFEPPGRQLAAYYGTVIDRLRKLDMADGKQQPIWAFVELGHPFTDNTAPTITGDQLTGAVWNSIIHEARGVIYFNHNFGGPCFSFQVLREQCGDAIRPTVTEINHQITELAPILNTQSYQWTFNPALDTMLKQHDGSLYIFAMTGPNTPTGTHTLTLPPGIHATHAQVLYENREIPITPTGITDTFTTENQHHIYRITP
ncbi:MAG TPA: hypothetical protein VFO16_18825 [Pseudonocardiaceae bacterium]|nr:hypothetical protein [Pseudonocardiaceae bacterium]